MDQKMFSASPPNNIDGLIRIFSLRVLRHEHVLHFFLRDHILFLLYILLWRIFFTSYTQTHRRGSHTRKPQKVMFFCQWILITLILFGTMSQSFRKIVPVVFELCAKGSHARNCGVAKVGDTTLGAGARELYRYPFRKIIKSQEQYHIVKSNSIYFSFFFYDGY